MKSLLPPLRILAVFVGGWLSCSASGLAASVQVAADPGAAGTQARVIVKFRASARTAALGSTARSLTALHQAAALGQRLGRSLRDGVTLADRTQLIHASGIDSSRLAAELAADPAVEYAVPDQVRRAHAIPIDPLYGSNTSSVALPYTPAAGQWYLRKPTASAPATTTQLVSSIDAETAWSLQTGSSAIVVAVLDSGVRPDHPDLSGRLVPGRDFLGNSWMAGPGDGDGWDPDPTDLGDGISAADIAAHQATSADPCFGLTSADASASSWHGTQVAALIAANHDGHGMAGVAPGVQVMPLRVLGKCGGFDSDIIAAARWAVGLPVVDPVSGATLPGPAVPARILSLSLGGIGNCSAAYRDALSAVRAAGALVVVSAGNDGGAVNTPANCDGVIAVGGTDHSGFKGAVATSGGGSFASSLGRHVTLTAPMGDCVNSLDPATRQPCLYPIVSAANPGDPGALAYSEPSVAMFFTGDFGASAANSRIGVGTSFAAPQVAGAAALVWSSNPGLSAPQVRSILQGTTRLHPSRVGGGTACNEPSSNAIYQTQPQGTCICTSETCGAGMLDAGAAVRAVTTGSQLFALIEGMPPVVNFDPTSTTVTSVILTGSAFRAGASGAILVPVSSYRWALGSGSMIAWMPAMSGAASQTFTVRGAGTFMVRLTVTDASGAQATSVQTLTVEAVSPSGGGTTGGGSTGGGTTPTSGSSTQSGLSLGGPEALLAIVLIALGGRRRRPR
jgi:serine protease